MTVRPGEGWGEPAALPADALVVSSDAELAAAAGAALAAGEEPPSFGLTGGDLHHTLGGTPGPPRWLRGGAAAARIDLLEVSVDGDRRWAAAHVVAQGRRGWAGPSYVAMNAAAVGDLRLGPRAHPGDGLVDVTEGRLRPSEVREGRRRMTSGSHLPHPGLATRRVPTDHVTFSRPLLVHLDGVGCGRVRDLAVVVHPDAVRVVV